MNIREYLGNKGVNKSIYKTLLSSEDRNNFFYYNNGVTLVCDKMSKINTASSKSNMNAYFTVDNPQIVNGCQTVNSIYEVLKNVDPTKLEQEYRDTFVMLKVLEIDRSSQMEEILYKDIVKFNNSQNAIDEKTFVANTSIFLRVQEAFEQKGFLLLIKQSDKNKFTNKYKTLTKLKMANNERINRFGLNEINRVSDTFIPLEKLLQVINAFVCGGQVAYVKKSNMLKFGTEQYNTATEFIKSGNVTNDALLDLYLLYKRADQSKQDDNRTPITYYLIDEFSKFECKGRKPEKILEELSDSSKIDRIIKLYTMVTKAYMKEYQKKFNLDYNTMIKRSIEYDLMDSLRDTMLVVI